MNIQNLVHYLWAWLQTGGRWDAITLAIGGFALAGSIVLTIRWAAARYRGAKVAAGYRRCITGRHYRERYWAGWDLELPPAP
jgi:hypothetical protein